MSHSSNDLVARTSQTLPSELDNEQLMLRFIASTGVAPDDPFLAELRRRMDEGRPEMVPHANTGTPSDSHAGNCAKLNKN